MPHLDFGTRGGPTGSGGDQKLLGPFAPIRRSSPHLSSAVTLVSPKKQSGTSEDSGLGENKLLEGAHQCDRLSPPESQPLGN